jgi:hypothetical protein
LSIALVVIADDEALVPSTYKVTLPFRVPEEAGTVIVAVAERVPPEPIVETLVVSTLVGPVPTVNVRVTSAACA